MNLDLIIEWIKRFLSFIPNLAKNAITIFSFSVDAKIGGEITDKRFFFNQYPYIVEIYLINKTDNPFYIDSVNIELGKRTFIVKDNLPIKNNTTPREPLRKIEVSPKSTKSIYGIVEFGYGFSFSQKKGKPKAYAVLKIGKRSIKRKLNVPCDIKTAISSVTTNSMQRK